MRLIALAIFLMCYANAAEAACRQALVLAIDVSSSVDATEYALQMQGMAEVLTDTEIQARLLENPDAPIELSIFEWSGRSNQRLILNWTRIETPSDLEKISHLLRLQTRPGGTNPTAIGNALAFAGQLLAQRPDCWRHTVDISGDGKNNDGMRPKLGKTHPIYDRATVNALVIGKAFENTSEIAGNVISELNSYFRQEVLHGPDAFIETALGFEDVARALKRKLLRETDLVIAMR
jgi:hypothetical protein